MSLDQPPFSASSCPMRISLFRHVSPDPVALSPVVPRLWVILALLLLSMLLNACAPPRPAPVVSREVGRQYKFAPKPGYYRVTNGDTIYSIAWRYGLDPRAFAKWNNIRAPYRIYPGRNLRVVPPVGRHVTLTVKSEQAVVRKAAEPPRLATMRPQSAPKVSTAAKRRIKKPKKTAYKLKLRWQWPTNGKVRVRFKRGDPSRKGVVLTGRLGQGVKAAEDGTVVYSGSGLIGYGQLLIIKHNKNYLSAYGHNKRLLVKEGDQVKKGARIAEMGTNGSGNIVLHFEIRRNGVPVDPLPLLPRKS